MDARKLTYDDNSIDLVIDKGTTDAVLCGKQGESRGKERRGEGEREEGRGG